MCKEGQRPEPVRALYDALVREHGYRETYKAVVRYVRRRASRIVGLFARLG